MINICLNTSPTTSSNHHPHHPHHPHHHGKEHSGLIHQSSKEHPKDHQGVHQHQHQHQQHQQQQQQRKMSQVVLCNHLTSITSSNSANIASAIASTPLGALQHPQQPPHADPANADNASEDSNPAPTIYRCRAPIASLDCMDDFSATSQQMLDQGTRLGSSYIGNHMTMHSSVTPGLRYKNLGKSGLRVSNIGLGTWAVFGPTVSEETSEEIINVALDSGINLFDLSEAHSGTRAETELGRILQRRNYKRSSIIITTKIYWSTKSDERGLSRKHIIESVKASLERLQIDYIDIVILHKVDHMCPMEEIVRAMNHVINMGWAMYWGTARWSAAEVMEAYTNCRQFNCVTPIVEQTEYHMFCREKPELYMPELYNKIGVGLMVWSAITTGKGFCREDVSGIFARSRFNRKYSSFSWAEDETTGEQTCTATKERGPADEARRHCEKLREIAELAASLNCTVSQLAVAWCLKNESVQCLLLGAVSVEQLYENIHALQILPQLSPAIMAEIERIVDNKPQRPPMISTLALRGQIAGTPRIESPKEGAPSSSTEECDTSSTKEPKTNAFCEIQ